MLTKNNPIFKLFHDRYNKTFFEKIWLHYNKPRRLGKVKMSYAFTLAEILITLGIIGGVAALTIPMLVVKYQKISTVTQLKKTYSQLNQALLLMKEDYGTEPFSKKPEEFISKYFIVYFKGATSYPSQTGNRKVMCYQEDSNYLAAPNSQAQYAWMNKQGKNSGYISTPFMGGVNTASVELPDGTCIGFNRFGAWDRANIFVDVNGSRRGPNRAGRDLFFFDLDSNFNLIPGEYPLKEGYSTYSCSKTGSMEKPNGYGCSAKLIQDGWIINSDYPWH